LVGSPRNEQVRAMPFYFLGLSPCEVLVKIDLSACVSTQMAPVGWNENAIEALKGVTLAEVAMQYAVPHSRDIFC
jgi:hypothetical protein